MSLSVVNTMIVMLLGSAASSNQQYNFESNAVKLCKAGPELYVVVWCGGRWTVMVQYRTWLYIHRNNFIRSPRSLGD